ncbi:cobyric acid synthase [Alicyclobacillus sp. ALC3]|nr:cobyric acid synthase [Alicyclobacillus sp. ALC3]
MRSLMIVGTASSVGKSIVCTGLCRIFYQDGVSVAPFKAQNMSLNSAVTPSGCEIGRAQAAQAEAAGIRPNEHMNPVLLKPTGNQRTQIVLQGRVHDTVSARHYFRSYKETLWQAVVESYQFLATRHDVIVMEGAGSPVEMNLKERDIANLRAAEMADAVVVLVADVDRGGVFASVVGTLQLMTSEERRRLKGILINRFRGDPELFQDGEQWLEQYTGLPVLGVIPYISNIGIDEEDSMAFESERYRGAHSNLRKDSTFVGPPQIRVAVVRLPHIANFTDFDPLFLEPDVEAFFTTEPVALQRADAIILPGTKSTMSDLIWLFEYGLAAVIQQVSQMGRTILGICGGYQMLGQRVFDPWHQEDERHSECEGIGIFSYETTIAQEKETILVEGDLLAPFTGVSVSGYEIHMGKTTGLEQGHAFARVSASIGGPSQDHARIEGAVSDDGRIVGTYLHGIFHNDEFRTRWLNQIRQSKGLPPKDDKVVIQNSREDAYDRLADVVRSHLNLARVYELLTREE